MRVATGLLLFVSSVACLLMGGSSLLWYEGETFAARTEAGDLSDVAGDLVDEKTLARDRARSRSSADMSAANLRLALSISFGVLGLLQILGGLLVFVRRARVIVLSIIVVTLITLLVVVVIDGLGMLNAITTGLLVAAIIASCLGWEAMAPLSP